MMKVLVVMPCYYPAIHYGGPITAVHQMNKALVKQGIGITVFTTNANGATKLDVPVCEGVDVDGVKVHYFPIPFGASYFYSPQLGKALKESLKDFDLVHINWMYVYTTMIAARLCTKVNIPYILTPHGMLDSYSTSIKSTWKKRAYISCIEKKHIMNAAVVHYSSLGEQCESVISDWNINTVVVPNGIESSPKNIEALSRESSIFEKHPELADKKLVLFIGRLNYIKGLDLLLKAWPGVVNSVNDAHLIIAGPDSDGYMEKLKDITVAERVTDSVTFTGLVLGKEKEELLRESSVFVSSSYLESFGMAIVEAMSYALPVTITDRVNIKSEIEEAKAGLVSSCDLISIAKNLIYLLQNRDEAKQMGLRGRKLVMDKYEMTSVVKQMKVLFEKINSKNTIS